MKKLLPSGQSGYLLFKTSWIIGCVFAMTTFISGCKKSDKPQTTIEKIQGKWKLVTDEENDHVAGQDNITIDHGGPGDIVDFRTDGTLFSDFMGVQNTSTYTLSGDTKIIFDGTQVFDIITITSNSFIFHSKEITGSDFYEITITLKK